MKGITNPALRETLQGFTADDNPAAFFDRLLPNLLTVAFIIGTLYFVYVIINSALHWILSQGDKQSLEGARHGVQNAFMGLIVLFSLYAVLNVLENFFGIDILTLDIAPLIIQ